MGYTVYWRVRDWLTSAEVCSALLFLASEYDPALFRLVDYCPGVCARLVPVGTLPVDSLFFFASGGFVGLGCCKTNRLPLFDAEVKR